MDFTHIFNQDDEAFFKNTDMRQLDQDIGDLDGIIKDTEGIIVAELEEFILEHSSFLRISFQALSNLDCILAFASCAMDLNFTKPQMVDSSHKKIHIKCGRHPLQEIITDFIPNNIRIDNEERLVIVSGPNFSGKSCYLRQVRDSSFKSIYFTVFFFFENKHV
jgi:DNA mismatch repair protein MSH5